MSSWGLAWRTVAREPARAVLAIAGVASIGALLFNMLLLSDGLLVSFRDLLDLAGFDIRIVANEGLPTHRAPIARAAELADQIARLPEVQTVAFIRTDTAVAIAPNGSRRLVTLIGSSDAQRRAWTIVKGEMPLAPVRQGELEPLVVSTGLAADLALEPGSTLGVRVSTPGAASALPAVAFRVVAIGSFAFDTEDEATAQTTMAGFRAARGGSGDDEADLVLAASRPGAGPAAAATAIARLRPDVHVYSNDQVVAQFNQNAFAYFRQISAVLSLLTLAFAFLLVATLLTMSVNQRLGEVAALRALGFPRRRIAANLLCESALLVGAGGTFALPIGGLLAVELDRILHDMPGVPARVHFFVLESRAVVLFAALLGATALLSALYPIWLAARLPIAATLRREILS